MVSRILISIALLCSSVAMSQDENGLTFSQVLLLGPSYNASPEIVVPTGKIWKLVSIARQQSGQTHQIYLNNEIAYPVNYPMWLPSGTIISNLFNVSHINVIEFNID